jgi:phosphate starvation-inducible PhoH-like protein
VVRHPLVQRIVEAYERFEDEQATSRSNRHTPADNDPGARTDDHA